MPKTMESGDNDEIAKTHWQNLKIFFLNFNQTWNKSSLDELKGIILVQKKGYTIFQREIKTN